MSLREIREKARAALHNALRIPALYLAEGHDPVECFVRVHTDNKALGDLKGTSFGYAERQEVIPKIVFLRAEVPNPVSKAIVSIAPDEAYRVDNVLSADGITVSAECTVLSAKQRFGLPVPDGSP
jgi:hypothetical protein